MERKKLNNNQLKKIFEDCEKYDSLTLMRIKSIVKQQLALIRNEESLKLSKSIIQSCKEELKYG